MELTVCQEDGLPTGLDTAQALRKQAIGHRTTIGVAVAILSTSARHQAVIFQCLLNSTAGPRCGTDTHADAALVEVVEDTGVDAVPLVV